ncbi:hypothetical protein [Actinoplanes sp. TFC3]|uniref:hypothetical protein n=1 Tax=Actinoplanes sp. TFC3 TaxID=1710355 RepID=UPI000AF70CEE|nr:hypothetical protein [Actinoplanes sp. TFC3]
MIPTAGTCRLVRALHLHTVAQGVETAELTLLGYNHGRGFYYARPLTADAFEKWMAQQSAVTPL